jgi:hypothetical protein
MHRFANPSPCAAPQPENMMGYGEEEQAESGSFESHEP